MPLKAPATVVSAELVIDSVVLPSRLTGPVNVRGCDPITDGVTEPPFKITGLARVTPPLKLVWKLPPDRVKGPLPSALLAVPIVKVPASITVPPEKVLAVAGERSNVLPPSFSRFPVPVRLPLKVVVFAVLLMVRALTPVRVAAPLRMIWDVPEIVVTALLSDQGLVSVAAPLEVSVPPTRFNVPVVPRAPEMTDRVPELSVVLPV